MLCAPLPLLISVAEVASSICARFNRVPFYFFGALFLWVFCTRCSRFFFIFGSADGKSSQVLEGTIREGSFSCNG